jgi:hypothetical protein
LLAYVQKHPDSYVALFAVINQADRYPYPAIFNKINDAFGEKIKQTKAFEYYTNKYDPKSTATADPDLLGTSIEGKKIRLSDFKGNLSPSQDFFPYPKFNTFFPLAVGEAIASKPCSTAICGENKPRSAKRSGIILL